VLNGLDSLEAHHFSNILIAALAADAESSTPTSYRCEKAAHVKFADVSRTRSSNTYILVAASDINATRLPE